MEFTYPDGYNRHVLIKDGKSHIGTILRCNRLNHKLFNPLTDEEKDLIRGFEKPGKYIHLHGIFLTEDYSDSNYLPAVISKFEEESEEQNYKAVVLFIHPELLDLFSGRGYKQVCYLESIDCYFLKKDLSLVSASR